jgi:hypothetical protein
MSDLKIWVLVNDAGETILPDAEVTDFRGNKFTLDGGRPPQHPGSTGRVWFKEGGEFFPGVVGLTWVQV